MSESPRRVPTRPSGPPLDGDLIFIEDEQRLAYGAGEVFEDVPKMSEIGAGGGLQPQNNLSDLENVSTAKTNLGLGSAANEQSSAFDPAGAAANALAAANAYTDQQIAEIPSGGGGIPPGDVHFTGKLICPASNAPQLVTEGDESTGWGWRQSGVLSAFVGNAEAVRIDGGGLTSFAPRKMNGPYQAQVADSFLMSELTLVGTGPDFETIDYLVPLNSRLEAVMVVVTSLIEGITSFSVKVSGGNPLVKIGTIDSVLTGLGTNSDYVLVPASPADQYNSQPAKITVSVDGGSPTAGQLRILTITSRFTPHSA